MRQSGDQIATTSVGASLVRVSVVGESRRLDVGLSSSLPLVEALPSIVRSLGVLDPSLVHGGFALRRADGSSLDQSLSPAAQGVHDGEVLTLARGTSLVEPRVYDDVTEAVIDAVSGKQSPWTARDSSRTALAVSMAFLALCALLLVLNPDGIAAAAAVAGAGAVLLLVAAAVIARIGTPEAGNALAIAASVFAGLAGYLVTDAQALWGWPLAAAAGGALAAGGIGFAIVGRSREVQLVPVAWAVAVGVPATFVGLGADPLPVYAMTAAVVGALSNLLPWLAMTSARLRAVSPQSDQEVFDIPAPIDAEAIARKASSAARVLNALRLGLGGAVITSTPLIASDSVPGAILVALVLVGMMFQSRQAYARVAVLVVMGLGAAGLALTGLTVTLSQPQLRDEMLIVLGAITIVMVALTLIDPKARLKLARVADTVEVIVLALVLPLGVIAAGWM